MIVQSIPYPPVAGAQLAYKTAESLAETSTTSSGYFDAATLNVGTGDFRSGKTYIGIWSVSASSSSTSSTVQARVVKDGTPISAAPLLFGGATTDYQLLGGMFKHDETGIASTFKLQCQRGVNPTTIAAKDARVSLVVLGSDDSYYESLSYSGSSDTTANKTAFTVATLTFTPATTGDYIVVCTFIFQMTSASNVQGGMQLTDGTNTTGEVSLRCFNSTDRLPCMLVLPLSSVSGSRTVDLKIRQTLTGFTDVGVSEVRFVALRRDRFADARSIIAGSSSGTEATYTSTGATQTFTPVAADYLTFGTWVLGTNNSSNPGYGILSDGGIIPNEQRRTTNLSVPASGMPVVTHQLAPYTAVSRTQVIQRKSGATGTSTTLQRPSIVSLCLKDL